MTLAGLALIEEWDGSLRGGDPLGFPGYASKLAAAPEESVRSGVVRVGPVAVALVETRFAHLGGTMGAAAGERIARAFDRATERGMPVLAVTGTGGARLQEGMVSLIQMGRTVAARRRHAAAGLLMVAVYGQPTTGGVLASWAGLGDLRAAVAGSTVAFGGPRVVEWATGRRPPPTSHTAESAHVAGLVDAVLLPGREMAWVEAVLGVADAPLVLPSWRPAAVDFAGAPPPADGWQAVRGARDPGRPSGLEWAAALTGSWVDLAAADPAIRAGLATLGDRRVVVVAMDRHARNDAAARPGPAAYRLVQRAVSLADQLGLPLLTLIDSPGADPGPAAEAGGIGVEIARALRSVAGAENVTVSVCVGEGGSGGAMALGFTDRAFMLHGSVFSVIGPEAAGIVLAGDHRQAPVMANALGLTGPELVRLGVVDDLLPDAGPDAVEIVRKSVLDAIDTAAVGDREVRAGNATAPWLAESNRPQSTVHKGETCRREQYSS